MRLDDLEQGVGERMRTITILRVRFARNLEILAQPDFGRRIIVPRTLQSHAAAPSPSAWPLRT
jgi:hypothetical protein